MNSRQLERSLLHALLVAAIAFAAAIGCAKEGSGDSVGRSSYLQSYSIPLAAAVPPLNPSIYNDEFNAQHPTSSVSPLLVDLNSKWSRWDFDEEILVAHIDPRMQMMQLITQGSTDKVWAGVYEALPVPTVDEDVVSYDLYARCVNSFVNSGADFADIYYGLLLSEDFTDDAMQFYAIAGRLARVDAGWQGSVEATLWPSYDAVAPAPDGEVLTWPAQYFRAHVTSAFNGPDDYTTSVRLDASQDGIGYQQVARYTGLDFPLRHCGLAQRSNIDAGQLHTLFDYVRCFRSSETDSLSTGRIQQLGSV